MRMAIHRPNAKVGLGAATMLISNARHACPRAVARRHGQSTPFHTWSSVYSGGCSRQLHVPASAHLRDPQQQQAPQLQHVSAGLLAAALSLSCIFTPPQAVAEAASLYDGARVFSEDKAQALSSQLEEFNSQGPWTVRVYTEYQIDARRGGSSPRQLWGPADNNTVIMQVDPSSPNVLNLVYVGDNALFKLRRPFLSELVTRFGNMFYVREQGEAMAVQSAVDVLLSCLGAEAGCRVVPGLPEDQYFFTLGCSIAGGLVAGFVSKIPPQGFVQRRWVWLLLFSPLWASLYINFGLGPVVSRTSDLAPLLGNTAGFAAAVAAVYVPQLMMSIGEPPKESGSSS